MMSNRGKNRHHPYLMQAHFEENSTESDNEEKNARFATAEILSKSMEY